MTLTGDVIKEIKEKNIKPVPRWQLQLRNNLWWLFVCLAAVAGGLIFGVVINFLGQNEWDLYRYTNTPAAAHYTSSIPFLWLLAFLVCFLMTQYGIRKTKNGYRHEVYLLITANIILICFAGTVLYQTNTSQSLERALSDVLPDAIDPFVNSSIRQSQSWDNPDKGVLAGEVVSEYGPAGFLLKSFDQNIWQIDKVDSSVSCQPEIKIGQKLKLIGTKVDSSHFLVGNIRPFIKSIFGF